MFDAEHILARTNRQPQRRLRFSGDATGQNERNANSLNWGAGIFILFSALCLAHIFPAGAAFAQTAQPPVEINLDILEPSAGLAPALPLSESPGNGAPPPLEYTPPPMFTAASPAKSESDMPAVPVGAVRPEKLDAPAQRAPAPESSIFIRAPEPPRRPKIMSASGSFIRQARQDYAKTYDSPSSSSPVFLEDQIADPGPEEILRLIENGKSLKLP